MSDDASLLRGGFFCWRGEPRRRVKRLEHDYLDTEKIASPETRPRMTALQHQQSRTWTVLRNP
jgi:hypothetical protein